MSRGRIRARIAVTQQIPHRLPDPCHQGRQIAFAKSLSVNEFADPDFYRLIEIDLPGSRREHLMNATNRHRDDDGLSIERQMKAAFFERQQLAIR